MAKLAVYRPFDEPNLDDDLGAHPVSADARQPDGFCERRLRDLERIQSPTELHKQLRVEPSANLSGKDEIAAIEVPDQQRAKADPGTLWIGEPTDHEFLRSFALHL